MPIVNFDANATHTLLPEVKQALTEISGDCMNPSSVHRGGQGARALVEEAREKVRLLCGASPRWRVIFTSGATEANNLAVSGVCKFLRRKGGEPCTIACSTIEHPSVLRPVINWSEQGIRAQFIEPGEKGTFSPAAVISQVSAGCKFISLSLANNETGQVLPLAEIAALVRERCPNALVHSDAVQALGRIDFSADALSIDLMSISGHKLGALSGIGALLVRKGVEIVPLIHGGAQEGDLRAGTENLFGIVSLGAACAVIRANLEQRLAEMRRRKDELWNALRAEASPVILNAWGSCSLPNTLNVRFPGVSADDLVVALDVEGVCISAGSACAAGKPEPSHVLQGMGVAPEHVRESVRLSLETHYTDSEFDYGVRKTVECVSRIRALGAGK